MMDGHKHTSPPCWNRTFSAVLIFISEASYENRKLLGPKASVGSPKRADRGDEPVGLVPNRDGNQVETIRRGPPPPRAAPPGPAPCKLKTFRRIFNSNPEHS
ncbi:hypothetical protein GN956_G14325 [Arapaima gigas]